MEPTKQVNPFEVKPKLTFSKEKSSSVTIEQFIDCIMTMAVVFHKLHLQTKGQGSYAQHKALNEIYDALPDHADGLVESYQGYYGKLIENYPSMDQLPYLKMTPLEAVSKLLIYVEDNRKVFGTNSMLQNQVDELVKLVSEIKYKLTFLS